MSTQLTVASLRHQAWALMVQEQTRSGLSVGEWCAQNNISEKSFYYRRKRVREEMLQSSPVFAELSNPTAHNTPSDPAVTISVNGMLIGVGPAATKQLLADVLEVVRRA